MEEILFSEIADRWLKDKEKYIKASTFAFYRFEMETYILPYLGHMPVHLISETELQNVVIHWQESGGKKAAPLKKSTVQNLIMLSKQCLRFAERQGYIADSSIRVRFMATDAIERKQKVFTKKEQTALIHAVLKEPSYKTFGILLCLCSGLRIGEVCALRWADIDLPNQILHITKTLQRIYRTDIEPHTRIMISSPKTSTSVRDIPLSGKLSEMIRSLPKRREDDYILTNAEYYMEPRTFRKFYMDFLKLHGITPLNFHCLRHTFATRCIEEGGDYKSVSVLLGHATINTTLNMYVHPQEEEKRKCIEMFRWE